MSVRHGLIRWLGVSVIGLGLVASGCTAQQSPEGSEGPPPIDPPPSHQASPLPAACADTMTAPEQAAAALARAQPGSTVCLSGNGLAGAELEVTSSGTAQEPITIVADGATVRSMSVQADYVTVQGLRLIDGDGLTMEGRGLAARGNVIYNATKDGLACIKCFDTVIESNIIQRADGSGLYLAGERITVQNNKISESVLRTQSDADGIRFFGVGHRLIRNEIRNIKSSGYRDEGPHTDCFQTFNTASNPPTYDIVIADNICTNVDVQCLIATANESGARATPAGQTTILFEHNLCSVGGSQAVLLEGFPGVVVRDNRFSGPGSRAVQLSKGSTDCAVIGNTVSGRMRPFEIDPESEPGFQESGNSER